MKGFTTLTSVALRLPQRDIDTDLIFPAQYLTLPFSANYADFLFRRLRDEQPDFPFNAHINTPANSRPQILIALANFGCGSSREHAVKALLDWGIRVIIAPSFADIFKSNAAKNGLLLIELPEPQVNFLLTTDSPASYSFIVDLEQEKITFRDQVIPFFTSPFLRRCLLQGYDEFDYLLAHFPEIKAFKKQRERQLFYTTTQQTFIS